MNLKAIEEILKLDRNLYDEDMLGHLILCEIAKEKEVIPNILKILEKEREHKERLIFGLNLNLSRSHIYLEADTRKEPRGSGLDKDFIMKEIQKFYEENNISHCFNRFNK